MASRFAACRQVNTALTPPVYDTSLLPGLTLFVRILSLSFPRPPIFFVASSVVCGPLWPLPSPSVTLQAELETRLQLGETAEQRRLRERNRVEEADNDLTEDLFGGGGGRGKGGAAGGLSGLALKSMQVCVYVLCVCVCVCVCVVCVCVR